MRLLLAFFENLPPSLVVLLAGEGVRQAPAHGREKSLELLAQLLSGARWHPNGFRTVRILEIEEITPIGRDLGSSGRALLFDGTLNMLQDRRGFACAGEPCDEDVVSGLIHAEAELEGPQCAFLPDEFEQGYKLVGAVKLERIRVLLAPELFDRDAECVRIDHRRFTGSVRGIEQPAVYIARVIVDIRLLEEKGYLPPGGLE